MGRNIRNALIGGCIAAALMSLAVAPASAAEEHLYDPVLSLTGGTAVSAEDPVPDPGPNHPPKAFANPCGTATDRHGYVYVANAIEVNSSIVAGRIDVFDAEGHFLLEFEDKDHPPCGLAVDSEGRVYTGGTQTVINIYEPSEYPPTASTGYTLVKEIALDHIGCNGGSSGGIGIDPADDHLYVNRGDTAGCGVREYGSAAEGWPSLDVIPGAGRASGIDVYGANHDIYIAAKYQTAEGHALPSKLIVLDGGDHHVKCEVLGAEEDGDLAFGLGASLAVDQSNGDAYVYDVEPVGTVYQFAVHGEGECEFIGLLPSKPPSLTGFAPNSDIAVDAPMEVGEPTYTSPNEGHVYVTSGVNANSSHLHAFKPRIIAPPEIRNQAFSGVTAAEAVLEAELNPSGLDTTYHFQYTTQASFEDEGYEGAASAPVSDASAGAGGAFIPVVVPVLGLQPDTAYRFRLVASNCADEEADPEMCVTVGEGAPGEEGEDASFSTYPAAPTGPPCQNAAVRTGASAGLPDCRAYELVTPPDTDGHIPTMVSLGSNGFGDIVFDTALASAEGESLVFGSNTGALLDLGHGGGFFDTYQAQRGAGGWQSSFTGMTGVQAEKPFAGGVSADHGYSLWNVESGRGTLATEAANRAIYLRVPPGTKASPNCAPEAEPEGRFEWLACGSLGFDPRVGGKWISAGGDHVIFWSGVGGGVSPTPAVQLEPCAPASGVRAIYDRTPGGPTSCISVPPAGASAATEALFEANSAQYKGASADGTAVAFTVAGTLYVRRDNVETLEVAGGGPTFGGLSADGDRAIYLDGGDVFSCELDEGGCAGEGAHQPIAIGGGGESTLVNISADGSHVYFVSPKQLDGPQGEEGKENLYLWDGEGTSFIAVLEPADVDGESDPYGQGLGKWVGSVVATELGNDQGPAENPSRGTPDGKVLVFQSRVDLTGFESEGHIQVFRYDAEAAPGEQLRCLSCNPTGAPASSDARLQLTGRGAQLGTVLPPTNATARIANLSLDGGRALFQSAERLVPEDLDGRLDVYQWEAQGLGGCARQAGCLSLISSPRSSQDEYLYAVGSDGSDVFFLSTDTLVAQDPDGTHSIYDARVGGGFPPPPTPPGDCLGEACQPAVPPPGEFGSVLEEVGKPSRATNRRCPKGKRKMRRAGRTHCVKRQGRGQKRAHRRDDNRRARR